MARARNIKPAFFMNEALVELCFETRLLFIGLWTLADREGRLEDRPKRIKMAVFPGDEVDVVRCLDDLERVGLIERYVADGVKVVLVTNFKKHQSPHHTEKGSVLPGRDGVYGANGANGANGVMAGGSRLGDGGYRADFLNPDCLNSDSLKDEKGGGEEDGEEGGKGDKKEGVKEQEKEKKEDKGGGKRPQKRRSRLSRDFVLEEADRVFAAVQGVDAGVELEAFRSHHEARGSLMLDWHAAWRAWCVNSAKFGAKLRTRSEVKGQAKGKGLSGKLSGKDYGKGMKEDGTVEF